MDNEATLDVLVDFADTYRSARSLSAFDEAELTHFVRTLVRDTRGRTTHK